LEEFSSELPSELYYPSYDSYDEEGSSPNGAGALLSSSPSCMSPAMGCKDTVESYLFPSTSSSPIEVVVKV
jgi:hypothetical protein